MNLENQLKSLYKKAIDLRSQGMLAESEQVELQAAAILQNMKTFIEQHPQEPESASLLLYLAEREWALNGDQPEVLAQMHGAIGLREKHLGLEHSETADALVKLAEIHYVSGRFETAEPLYARAIDIYRKNKFVGGTFAGLAFQGMAQTLSALGHAQEADGYFAEAIERVPSDDQGKRSLYFLLIYRAEGLEKLHKQTESESRRQRAATLLPQANPGEFGFRA